jgi:hypothetical protein
MKCFQHNETDAIGICRNCHKGVCRQCAAVVDGCLACRYVCEQKVELANRVIAYSVRAVTSQPKTIRSIGLILLVAGAIMIGVSLRLRDWNFLAFFGVFLLLVAAIHLLNYRRLTRRP